MSIAPRIAEIITTAPGWMRVGITAPDPRQRAEAIATLAEVVAAKLDEPLPPTRHPAQMALPL